MQTISTRSLLHAAPIGKEWRDKMLAIVDTMDADIRYEVEKACWQGIAELFALRLDEETYRITKEIDDGIREYNRDDYANAEEAVYREMAVMLDGADSEVAMEEIRRKLQEQLKPQEDAS